MLVDVEYLEEILAMYKCPVYPEYRLALVGFSMAGLTRAIYDYNKCATILMNKQGITKSEACDYLDYNVVDNHIGERTPMFIATQQVTIKKGIGVLTNERRQVRHISNGD